ncbi:hypothetical protein BU26DRAFT_301020 [Trematosphaeria pertusa]|uniref:Uncharacterized protein n=1 Tax=Trematosphaeria pertusa TaxID=390896 RepID=A0A6A6IIK0_9PLEO|nr:uncharacterized protein BU26DRAFT_301020 [Trematosphaeria pertusa]KAF2250404.1 hypothetical protein BU26DRAFT_301020 [Trematosphaeria pertusa]
MHKQRLIRVNQSHQSTPRHFLEARRRSHQYLRYACEKRRRPWHTSSAKPENTQPNYPKPLSRKRRRRRLVTPKSEDERDATAETHLRHLAGSGTVRPNYGEREEQQLTIAFQRFILGISAFTLLTWIIQYSWKDCWPADQSRALLSSRMLW